MSGTAREGGNGAVREGMAWEGMMMDYCSDGTGKVREGRGSKIGFRWTWRW